MPPGAGDAAAALVQLSDGQGMGVREDPAEAPVRSAHRFTPSTSADPTPLLHSKAREGPNGLTQGHTEG